MKTVSIGFSRARSKWAVLSVLLRIWDNVPFSHTYLRFHTKYGDVIYEAVNPTVRFVGTKVWNKKSMKVAEFEITITEKQYDELMRYCINNAGLKYSIIQLVGIAVSDLLNLDKNTLSSSSDTKICSEVLAEMLISIGYSFDKDTNLVHPKDIYNALK